MDKLLIHSTTEHMLADQLQSPSHAVLLVGPIGSGKTTLARSLSMQLLGLADLANYPYYLELVSTDTRVGIDDIRSIRGFMKRTTTGSRAIRRVCLIDSVDDMTSEAANALLKMLEEPAEDTVFVLTAATQAKVPQTILSRVQQVSIHSVGEDMAVRHLKDKYAEADI
ncbi:AAA family ATPase, partial [Candidatus Saccharibacteria bacterium]|nr:AAA family ATPase [Candidatus Saccharibacteria bacterium]